MTHAVAIRRCALSRNDSIVKAKRRVQSLGWAGGANPGLQREQQKTARRRDPPSSKHYGGTRASGHLGNAPQLTADRSMAAAGTRRRQRAALQKTTSRPARGFRWRALRRQHRVGVEFKDRQRNNGTALDEDQKAVLPVIFWFVPDSALTVAPGCPGKDVAGIYPAGRCFFD